MGVAKELVASIDTCAARAPGEGLGPQQSGDQRTRRDIISRLALDLGLVVQNRVQQ